MLTGTKEFLEARAYFQKENLYTKSLSGTYQFDEFWDEERRKCLEGVTKGGLYIPGTYYFYLNYYPILGKDEVTGRKTKIFPRFTDVDLEYFTIVEEARKQKKGVIMTKPRRTGFSYKNSCLVVHEYNFFRDAKCIIGSFEKKLSENTMNMALDGLNHLDQNTVWFKPRNPDTKEFVKARHQKTINGVNTWAGYNSEIRRLTFMDNPQSSVGLSANIFLFEEAGLFPNIIESFNYSEPTWKDGDSMIGVPILYGTAGDMGGSSDEFSEMFYNPDKFNLLSFDNIWEPEKQGKKVGWFLPSTKQRFGTYKDKVTKVETPLVDEEGNSNIELSLLSIQEFRETKKGDPKAYRDAITQYPLTPSEAFLKTNKSPFPLHLIQERLAELETKQSITDAIWYADLVIQNDNIEFQISKKEPITIFPIRDKTAVNLDTCIEIYEQPYDDKPAYGVYIAGIDPYDDDEAASSDSLGSCIIMNSLTNRVVAQYTARPTTAKEFYENVRRLLMYYNAIANYENNKKGIFAYFENKNCLHLLADTPKILKDQQIIKTVYETGNNSKGTNASKEVNKYARELYKTYLYEQAYDKPEGITNTHVIVSKLLLKETELWNIDGNFDRVSAMMMLMVLKEDRVKMIASREEMRYESQDEFFERNWQENKNSYMGPDFNSWSTSN